VKRFAVVLLSLGCLAFSGWGISHLASRAERSAAAPPVSSTPASPHVSASDERAERGRVRSLPLGKTAIYRPVAGSTIDLADLPTILPTRTESLAKKEEEERQERPLSSAQLDRLKAAAMRLAPNSRIFDLRRAERGHPSLQVQPFADSIDGAEACGPCRNTPPDPEIAVGEDHVVAVVNVSMEIYDKNGNALAGPIYFRNLFAGVPGCAGRYFDPSVVYDEKAKRFVVGVDAVFGAAFCVAASATSDPTGTWHRYGFQTIPDANTFFDFPHLGVGRDAIYMGGNNFVGPDGDFESRLWALHKDDLYSGAPLRVVSRALGFNREFSPRPVQVTGAAERRWPRSGPHYIVTDDRYDGVTYGVWSWSDPFAPGGGDLVKRGVVDLVAATGVPAALPPQLGGQDLIANDRRVQDSEMRDGEVWFSTSIGCNPGAGTVGCTRWARLDPRKPKILDAGVIASDGMHRSYASVAVDACGNMAIGYTLSSADTWHGIAVTGRRHNDRRGTVLREEEILAGQAPYTGFEGDPARWGDYTKMAIDPNGRDFYYLGQYTKDIDFPGANFGTHISKLSFDCKVK
jgi:hypothetical protein